MLVVRIILWILLGLIVLLLLTPVGADIGYEGGVLRVSAKVWGLKLQLIPRPPAGPEKPKKEKKPKPEEKKAEQPKEEKPRVKRSLPFEKDELLELLLRLLRVVLKGFGRFGRKFRVDRFRLCYLAAGHDPYNVAVSFAWLNAALSSLAPICRRRFDVKDCEVRTAIDFTEDWPQLELALAFSIRLGQILGTVFSIAFGALWVVLPALLRKKRAAKKNSPAAAGEQEQTTTDTTDTTIDAEKEDSNG